MRDAEDTLAATAGMFVQIVKFKLKPGSSREVFLDLSGQMVAWLQNRAGFVAYELYEGDPSWSDRIVWEDRESAKKGLQGFLATDIAGQIIHLIEDGHSSFFGHAVVSTQINH